MHDLVIRNALIVDGTGAPARPGDVAIQGEHLVEVGGKVGPGHREINADGLLLAPGWVDVHTHYDGQATWDPYLTPSCWHGVTTAVMGNCGVGFAPVAPARRDWLIGLMEGVEDIPGSALAAGIKWEWGSFPEYLDALGRSTRALDIAAQVPHAAVRAYVMGERGPNNQGGGAAGGPARRANGPTGSRAAPGGVVEQALPLAGIFVVLHAGVSHFATRLVDHRIHPRELAGFGGQIEGHFKHPATRHAHGPRNGGEFQRISRGAGHDFAIDRPMQHRARGRKPHRAGRDPRLHDGGHRGALRRTRRLIVRAAFPHQIGPHGGVRHLGCDIERAG